MFFFPFIRRHACSLIHHGPKFRTVCCFGTKKKIFNGPSPLQEFSVVYTDRALNHMSVPFQKVMIDIGTMLKSTYRAKHAVIIPGSGTFGMEAVARQFANNKKVMILRNGYFSFRWSQILDVGGGISSPSPTVLKARCVTPHKGCGTNECSCGMKSSYMPVPIQEVVAAIAKERPAVVFAPHVETSTGIPLRHPIPSYQSNHPIHPLPYPTPPHHPLSAGIILPDAYLQAVSQAVHGVGGLFVLDCIASGTVWVDMEELGIDALITAPQKGWSGPACAGLVMLSDKGVQATRSSESSSFSCNLRKWLEIMDAYEAGAFAYHTTMPTDALFQVREAMTETLAFGHHQSKDKAWELGTLVRDYMCKQKGFVSVAAEGYEAPGVVVVHTDDAATAAKFTKIGTQIAAGVSFQLGEPPHTKTFRIGLFGLDKLRDPIKTLSLLRQSFDDAHI